MSPLSFRRRRENSFSYIEMLATAAILIVLHGPVGIIAVVPVIVVGWSRLELRQHSLAQAVVGTLLASAVVVAVFSLVDLP